MHTANLGFKIPVLLSLAVTVLLVLAPGCSGRDSDAQTRVDAVEFRFTYADIGANRGPRAAALNWWAKELHRRSKGRIQVDISWSESLVKGRDVLKAVGAGFADMGTVAAVNTPAEQILWTFGGQPLNETDTWVAMRAWHELREVNVAFAAEAKRYNLKVLFHNGTGPAEVLCRDELVKTAGDIKGKKIRATVGFIPFFDAMGANVVNTMGSETYAALDRGIIDCTVGYSALIRSYKHYEVADYLLLANLGQNATYGGVINLDYWNTLPADIKNIITQTSSEYVDLYARNTMLETDDAIKTLQAGIDGKKLTVTPLDPAERRRWSAYVGHYIADWQKKTRLPKSVTDQFISDLERLLEKYRRERDDIGYPWERQVQTYDKDP